MAHQNKNKHHLLQSGIFILSLLFALPSYAQSCGQEKCSSASCSMSTGADGRLTTQCPSGTRYDVDPNCIMNQNAKPNSCMDTMPVSSINRVSETNCFRANGAGGNSKPRNHLGTDYAATAGTVITAAADGVVKYAKWMSGGGRTVMIEHEKSCLCTAGSQNSGCENKYVSVYMHMLAWKVSEGAHVTKGTPIGLVGGSNYSSTGVSCDYNTPVGNCKPYGPHLHFEIHSGSYDKGYSKLKTSIINPLCDDIQKFCGGCSYDVDQCQNKDSAKEWEKLSDDAAQNKQQAASTGLNTPSMQDQQSEGMSAYAAESGKCDLANFLPQSGECYFCPLFTVLFNTASKISQKSYTALADGIVNVVLVAFAIWVAIYVLRFVSAFEVQKPSKMLQGLLVQAFKVLVAVLILKASYFQVLNLTVAPVFNTGMAYTQSVTGQTDCSSLASQSYYSNIAGYGSGEKADGGLPKSMGQNIVCSIKSMQDGVARILAYGRQARCVAWKTKKAIIPHIIPSFPYLITGDLLIIGAVLLIIAFPWCLVDCILNLAVSIALAPAAIGAWAFKITSQYLTKIWNFIMNAMFQFVFLSLILYIIMTVVNQFMQRLDNFATRVNPNGAYEFLIDTINGLAFWGVNGLRLIVICLLGWVFLDQGKELAGKFASAPDLDIGRKTGGFFAQVGKRIAVGSKDENGEHHGGALGIGKTVGSTLAFSANATIGQGLRRAQNNIRINRVKNNGTATTDAQGNTVYEKTSRNLLGQKVTRRVTVGADGQEQWSKEKQRLASELLNKHRQKSNADFLNTAQTQDKAMLDMFNNPPQGYKKESIPGAEILKDAQGNILAQKTVLENGDIQISTEDSSSVWRGNQMLSTTRSHRNALGEKVTITANRRINPDGTLSNGFDMQKTKNSLRMEQLQNISGAIQKQTEKFSNKMQTMVSDNSVLGRALKKGASRLNQDVADFNQFTKQYAAKSQTDLNSTIQNNKTLSSDSVLSVQEQKNASGRVVQKDLDFKTPAADYIVEKDGTVRMDIVHKLEQESNFDQQTLQEAVSLKVLETRGISVADKFQSRDVQYQNNTLTISQTNQDGSKIEIKTSFGGQNQMLSEVKITGRDGQTKVITDNGVRRRTVTYQNGDTEGKVSYGFNDYYYRRYSYHNFFDKNQNYSPVIDKEAAELGFTQKDLDTHAAQVADKNKAQKVNLADVFGTPNTRP